MFPYNVPIERIDWAASTFKPRSLPAGVYRGLLLDMVLTTTNGGAADIDNYGLAKAISQITVKLNGQDNMMIMPGYHLEFMNRHDFSIACRSTIDTVVGAGKTQKISMYIPFALTRSARAKDSVLDARASNKITSVELGIDWAAAAIGTDMTVTSGYINLLGILYDQVPSPIATFRHEFAYIKDDLNAVGDVDVKMSYGGWNEYRRLYIYTFDNTGALSDSQISGVKVKSLSYSWQHISVDQLKALNNNAFSLAPSTGVYILDLTTDGMMSERLNARNLSELILKFTSLVANGTVEIVAEKVIGA